MDDRTILSHIDHTALKAVTTSSDIRRLCVEAHEACCASVCIPPSFVSLAAEWRRENMADLSICTVIGFPLGYNTSAEKIVETTQAINDGADEIDVVINLGMVKDGDFEAVTNELTAVRLTSQGKIMKVIIETCYLTEEEKIRLCEIVTQVGADYIKTSTGFGSAGATLEDIALFRTHIGPKVKIKAAGGIRTREQMVAFLEAGCDRLGSSAGVQVLLGQGEPS